MRSRFQNKRDRFRRCDHRALNEPTSYHLGLILARIRVQKVGRGHNPWAAAASQMRLPSLEGASGVTSEPVIFENVASRTVARPSETVRSKAVVMLKSSGLKQNLINAAGRLVAAALQKGNPPAVASPSNEPTAVAAVTWVAMPDIVAQWRPVLRPLGFKIALHSVFCHQSPQVSFLDRSGKTQRCELADLLIVVDETASGAIQDRRAVFVQAKMFSASGVISISTASRDQLELYELWPSFSFVSGPYKPVPRDFAGSGQPGSSNEFGPLRGYRSPSDRSAVGAHRPIDHSGDAARERDRARGIRGRDGRRRRRHRTRGLGFRAR